MPDAPGAPDQPSEVDLPMEVQYLDPGALLEVLSWFLKEEADEDCPTVIKTRWAKLKAYLDERWPTDT